MIHKYRIVKYSDKPYYTLERKVISRFTWITQCTRWRFVDLHDNLDYLKSKAESIIEEEKNPIKMVIMKEYEL